MDMEKFVKVFMDELNKAQDEMAASRSQMDSSRSQEYKRGLHTGEERGLIKAGMHLSDAFILHTLCPVQKDVEP